MSDKNRIRYIGLEDQAEAGIYADYLSYRVQRDLYEICRETGPADNIKWEDFVLVMRAHKDLRDAAIAVTDKTLERLLHDDAFYDFSHTGGTIFLESDMADIQDGNLYFSQLFLPKEGRGRVNYIFYETEVAYYQRQRKAGIADSWDQYIDSLSQGGPLWDEVFTAFRNVLARLDFKAAWRSESGRLPEKI